MSVGNNGIDVRDVLPLFFLLICVKRFCFEKMSSVISRNVDRYIAPCWPLYRAADQPELALNVLSKRFWRAVSGPIDHKWGTLQRKCLPLYRALLTEISRSVDRNIALQVVYYQWLRVTMGNFGKKIWRGIRICLRRCVPPAPLACKSYRNTGTFLQNSSITRIYPIKSMGGVKTWV